jgi:hypothetical protein
MDHGTLKTAFIAKDGPLKHRKSLRDIGELVIGLQTERHRADYLPPNKSIFSSDKTKTIVDQARRAVREIENLSDDDRIALATSLLFKGRSQ